VQIIDSTGVLLNFGGQVIKNVAGYDVARLLVGSKGQLAMVTQISCCFLISEIGVPAFTVITNSCA
jgi:hypothetical protein